MALIDLQVQAPSFSLDMSGTFGTSVPIPLKDSTNANVTLTTPTINVFVAPQGEQLATSEFDIAVTPSVITNAAGKLVAGLLVSSAQVIAPQLMNYSIYVTPSGGDAQLLAKGTCSLF
jgi:hypothetical protein